METLDLIAYGFDVVLALGLLWLAWCLLNSANLFKAIVLFIAFGLFMSLVWVRMNAPDVALAEAAIGAGLTGALLLAALARLRFILSTDQQAEQYANQTTLKTKQPQKVSITVRLSATLITLTIAAGLAYSILSLPTNAPGLSQAVKANLALSGVTNPVTAVILNFRGYDTLLEMMVLLIALLAVWSFGFEYLRDKSTTNPPVLTNLSYLLAPMLILLSAYLLWVGAHAPGGAFQAGSVLSAAGVLLLLMGWRMQFHQLKGWLRTVLIAGAGTFLLIAALTLLFQGQLLKFPPDQAGIYLLILEAIATISISATLLVLFWLTDP